jgi:hypothetical protein
VKTRKGVLTHGNVRPPEVIMLLGWLGAAPKPLAILHPKGIPAPDHVEPLIGLAEVEGDPLPMPKSKLGPPLEKNLEVSIDVEGMGIGTLSILMDGDDDIADVPHSEEPKQKGKDGASPMKLRDGNVDITGMPLGESPLVLLGDGLVGSATLDDTLGPDMVGGWLNKEKGALKISFTWTSKGTFGSVKGGMKFGGGNLSTTSTSTKLVSSNQT